MNLEDVPVVTDEHALALGEPRCALAPIRDGRLPASAFHGRGASLGRGVLLCPSRLLGLRHVANHELARRDLLANVLELDLTRLLISLSTRLRHLRSLAFCEDATPER